ncbi:hypothetical protein SDC9_129650 [bioreactor metagenome]|uniref:Uncharacterized protein n=1 Tax=bioreactor metagenome TaxID=1076179 RepID=A0A645D089_9ZZZZ
MYRFDLRVIERSARIAAADHQRDDDDYDVCGAGGPAHRADMLEEVGSGDAGSEVGRIREGRHLVAEICSRYYDARRDRSRNAESHRNTEERDADRSGGAPRGAGRQRDDGADEERREEEYGWRQY